MKLVSQQKVSLKDHPEINEKAIQDYIFDNPSVLGLGDLQPIMKEKVQPQGGRLDMLFSDDDNNRYEVELQLGATDPSHIIRTLEYWDSERKSRPEYDHTAVIIAEDITSRFQNVISLFNNQIPLIALQISATKTSNGDLAISFVKIMDRIVRGTDEEEYTEPTDRAFWDKKSSKAMTDLMEKLFEKLGERKEGYNLKYNKLYVGVEKDGVAKNFITFVPKKSFVVVRIHTAENEELTEKLDQAGLDVGYSKRNSRYILKFKHVDELADNLDDVLILVDSARGKKGL